MMRAERCASFKINAGRCPRHSCRIETLIPRARRHLAFTIGERSTVRTLPEVISHYVAAYNRKDVPGMLTCLTHDVVFRNRVQGRLTVETSGRRAFEELAKIGAFAFEIRHQAVIRAISVEDTVLAEIEFTGTASDNPPPGLRAGECVAVTGASLFRLEGGLIHTLVDES